MVLAEEQGGSGDGLFTVGLPSEFANCLAVVWVAALLYRQYRHRCPPPTLREILGTKHALRLTVVGSIRSHNLGLLLSASVTATIVYSAPTRLGDVAENNWTRKSSISGREA
jgi:hypothetical protein